MSYLEKYKERKLIIYGTGIFICSYIFAFLYSFFANTETSGSENGIVLLPLIYGVLIAPVIEELIFRGIYTKKNIFLWFYIIGVTSYILLLKAYIGIPVFLIHLWILISQKKEENKYVSLGYFLNAFLFSVMHINLSEDIGVITLLQTSIRLGIGLILIWLVLNFNLLVSIIVHSLHNFIVFLIQFIAVSSMSDMDITKTVDINSHRLEWKTNNDIFLKEKRLLFSNDTLKGYNCTFQELLSFRGVSINNDTVDFNTVFKKQKYDILLIKKDSLSAQITEQQLTELLLKAGILNKTVRK